MKWLYIAGPMSGYDDFNYPAFHEAERRLWKLGTYLIINPAKNFDGKQDLPRSRYLRLAVQQVADSDAIVLLPGWKESRGALMEFYIAQELGMDIFEYDPEREGLLRLVQEGKSQ